MCLLQAQQMIADNSGLALAVSLSYACRNDPRARQLLPLLAFPLLATGDLCSIYRELKSIHLRNLNKERAEIVAEMWLEAGRIPSAAEVPLPAALNNVDMDALLARIVTIHAR